MKQQKLNGQVCEIVFAVDVFRLVPKSAATKVFFPPVRLARKEGKLVVENKLSMREFWFLDPRNLTGKAKKLSIGWPGWAMADEFEAEAENQWELYKEHLQGLKFETETILAQLAEETLCAKAQELVEKAKKLLMKRRPVEALRAAHSAEKIHEEDLFNFSRTAGAKTGAQRVYDNSFTKRGKIRVEPGFQEEKNGKKRRGKSKKNWQGELEEVYSRMLA